MVTISCTDFEQKIQQLYTEITKEGYKPDVIVGIARGGTIPATRLSYMFGVKEYGITITKNNDNKDIRELQTKILDDLEGKNVLLIEDVLETGDSLRVGKEYLELIKKANVKTAAFYTTSKTTKNPDFYLGEIEEVPAWWWESPIEQ